METEYMVRLITLLVALVLGAISKKNPKISNKLIPVQNLIVGLIVAGIQWIITKDFSVAVALSGVLAGGTYDIVHNLEKIIRGDLNAKG